MRVVGKGYQPKRPLCVQCGKRTKKYKYVDGKAVCLSCLEKEESKKKKLALSTRDAEYWGAYRKHLGVE